eukprot:symbB.v1.2.038497.t1/scaffold5891.1/size22729/4
MSKTDVVHLGYNPLSALRQRLQAAAARTAARAAENSEKQVDDVARHASTAERRLEILKQETEVLRAEASATGLLPRSRSLPALALGSSLPADEEQLWDRTPSSCEDCAANSRAVGMLELPIKNGFVHFDKGLHCCRQQQKLWEWSTGKPLMTQTGKQSPVTGHW